MNKKDDFAYILGKIIWVGIFIFLALLSFNDDSSTSSSSSNSNIKEITDTDIGDGQTLRRTVNDDNSYKMERIDENGNATLISSSDDD